MAVSLRQALMQALQLNARNAVNLFTLQRMKHHHLINTVDKFRPEMPLTTP